VQAFGAAVFSLLWDVLVGLPRGLASGVKGMICSAVHGIYEVVVALFQTIWHSLRQATSKQLNIYHYVILALAFNIVPDLLRLRKVC